MSRVICITGAASEEREHVFRVRAALRISSHRGPARLPFREEDGGGPDLGEQEAHGELGVGYPWPLIIPPKDWIS